jgi:arsenite oxidase large subunit
MTKLPVPSGTELPEAAHGSRWPYPFIEINPDDMEELNVSAGDLVEVYNDDGSTQAMVYPTPTAKKGHTFMLFAFPSGVQGNIVNAGINELIFTNYKQTWTNIRKLASAPASVKHLSLKSQEYKMGGAQPLDWYPADLALMLAAGYTT